MNDEIKQLLIQLEYFIEEDYKYYNDFELNKNQIKQLLDYITNLQQDMKNYVDIVLYQRKTIDNLQQENERLKENLQQEKKDFKEANDYCFELKDYKSRCEKASEYFKYQLENLDFYEDTKARMLCAMGIILLQNGSENDE